MRASLKIPTATLIANAERQRTKAQRDYERALNKYEKAIPVWEEKVRDAFFNSDPSTVTVESEYCNGSYRRVIKVLAPHLKGDIPSKPRKPDTDSIEADIRFLKATSQEAVNVSLGSNFSRYI